MMAAALYIPRAAQVAHEEVLAGVSAALNVQSAYIIHPLLAGEKEANSILIYLCAETIPPKVLCQLDGCWRVGIPSLVAHVRTGAGRDHTLAEKIVRCREAVNSVRDTIASEERDAWPNP